MVFARPSEIKGVDEMNFKVRKEYFYALFSRVAYMFAGMVALVLSASNQLEGVIFCLFIMFFAVYFSDKEAEQKEARQ